MSDLARAHAIFLAPAPAEQRLVRAVEVAAVGERLLIGRADVLDGERARDLALADLVIIT